MIQNIKEFYEIIEREAKDYDTTLNNEEKKLVSNIMELYFNEVGKQIRVDTKVTNFKTAFLERVLDNMGVDIDLCLNVLWKDKSKELIENCTSFSKKEDNYNLIYIVRNEYGEYEIICPKIKFPNTNLLTMKRISTNEDTLEVTWTGSYPNLCGGEWIIRYGGVYLNVPERYKDVSMYTARAYETWYFNEDYIEDWEDNYDGLEEEEWIESNREWVTEMFEEKGFEVTESLLSLFFREVNASDFRTGE